MKWSSSFVETGTIHMFVAGIGAHANNVEAITKSVSTKDTVRNKLG